MTLDQWFSFPENYQALDRILKSDPMKTVMGMLKERGLPRTEDVSPSDIASAGSKYNQCAGWHNCLRFLESLAGLPPVTGQPFVLKQYSDEYVKKEMEKLGKRIREPEEVIVKKPRKSK